MNWWITAGKFGAEVVILIIQRYYLKNEKKLQMNNSKERLKQAFLAIWRGSQDYHLVLPLVHL